jgi:transcriptional regulator with XRE-family HTH domain
MSINKTNVSRGRRVPRLLIGRRLRELRQRAGFRVEEAAGAARLAQATVWRMERGDVRCRYRSGDVRALGRVYGAGDAARGALVEAARQVPWFAGYRRVVPDGFETYLELERCARRVLCYSPDWVPELLETEEYATAVIGVEVDLTDEEVGSRVRLCMARQRVLGLDDREFVFVVGEAALRRPVWGGALLARQLRHLVEVGKRANVSVRVVPADADVRHACGVEGFEVFGEGPGVGTLGATVFVAGEGQYLEDPVEVERIRRGFGEAEGRALDESGSRELIERVAAGLEARYLAS